MRLSERTPIRSRNSSRSADRRRRAPAGWAADATRRTYGRIRPDHKASNDQAPWRQPKTVAVAAGVGITAISIGAGVVRARSRKRDGELDENTDAPQQTIDTASGAAVPEPTPADTSEADVAPSA